MYSEKFEVLCADILKKGRERYSLSMGIVSHIKNDRYWIVAVSSEMNVFVAGEDFPLNDTYCREVYSQKKTIALTEIDGTPGLQKHPLYQALTLEAYISTPIILESEVWGTLNFSSMKLRGEAFNDEDIKYIENAARRIAKELQDSSTL